MIVNFSRTKKSSESELYPNTMVLTLSKKDPAALKPKSTMEFNSKASNELFNNDTTVKYYYFITKDGVFALLDPQEVSRLAISSLWGANPKLISITNSNTFANKEVYNILAELGVEEFEINKVIIPFELKNDSFDINDVVTCFTITPLVKEQIEELSNETIEEEEVLIQD